MHFIHKHVTYSNMKTCKDIFKKRCKYLFWAPHGICFNEAPRPMGYDPVASAPQTESVATPWDPIEFYLREYI
jgi:hypothetical protein